MLRSEIIAPKTKTPLKFQRIFADHIIPFCVEDVILFSQLLNSSSFTMLSQYLGFSNSYLSRLVKQPKNTAIHDDVGMELLKILDSVYGLIDQDLPYKIARKLLVEHDAFLDPEKTIHSDEYVSSRFRRFYGGVLSLRKLDYGVKYDQIQELLKLANINNTQFLLWFDQSKRHDNTMFNYIEPKRTLKIWVMLGDHFGLLNKDKIFQTLNNLSMANYLDFEQARENYQKWIWDQT